MPVKRRLSKQVDGRITPSIIAAYKHAVELRERGADPEELYAAESSVERLIGGGIRRLWLPSIFNIDHRHPHLDDPDWVNAAELRRQLDAALAEAKRQRAEPEAASA